jgi:hypothetical protein
VKGFPDHCQLDVVGDLAVINLDLGGFALVDVSDRTAPVVVGGVDIQNSSWGGVALVDHYLLAVGEPSGGVVVVDRLVAATCSPLVSAFPAGPAWTSPWRRPSVPVVSSAFRRAASPLVIGRPSFPPGKVRSIHDTIAVAAPKGKRSSLPLEATGGMERAGSRRT